MLKGDVGSTENSSVDRGKGRVPGHDRVTRMTVSKPLHCKYYVHQLCVGGVCVCVCVCVS